MQEAQELTFMTFAEFDAMEKEACFNYELIDGVVMISPSPTWMHQGIAGNVHFELRVLLQNVPCQPLCEYDITFNNNVYKPDVMVFCEDNTEIPKIIVEILSPSTKRKDLIVKSVKYEEAGAMEYWIIDPKLSTVTVHDFVNATSETYGIGETIRSLAQPEIILEVAKLFIMKIIK